MPNSSPLLHSPLLAEQQEKSWQQFSQQHPNSAEQLTAAQLALFKNAIMLSDFILRSAIQAPEIVIKLFASEQLLAEKAPNYKQLLSEKLQLCSSEAQLHQCLRLFRLEHMVDIAVGDLLLKRSLDESLQRLSSLADNIIIASNHWLEKLCHSKWGVPVNSAGERQSLLVYGMGKLGGKELNFSSDIDLIFAYPEAGETQGLRRSIDNQLFFTRLGQKLITALNQQTADGFVYRVDMRLRPFGESGPLVMSFNALENYYQDQGRDWERYAMLKARLIGEGKYHGQLSNMLRPFVYRRYIDFSVIDSLRRMKAMIAQEVRRKQLKNNIKLGAGGIREVEFIVQVFQMIRGGRVRELQHRNLLTVLPLLVKHSEISQHSAQILTASYRFLRRVENIMQALNDQQTQTLPDNALDQARILAALAAPECADWPAFIEQLAMHMQGVHREFDELIGEESPNRKAIDQYWSTLWDSQWSDEEAIAWIEQAPQLVVMADGDHYWQSETIWMSLRDFRQEMSKRSMGNRGRQVLDKLVPTLLWHLAEMKLTDQTLARVLTVLTTIATRTAYLELLFENEGALKQLIHLCDNSSWVAEHIAKFPILLDELIDPKLFHQPPLLSSYAAELREIMLRVPEDDQETQMITLREFKQAKQLRIAAADITGILAITKVSDHLTALAEAIIAEVANLAWQQVVLRFGVPSSKVDTLDKGFAIIGYGKLGGIELGYSSDLDLVFVHDANLNAMTTGAKAITAGQFYLKLAQRMMHLFNTRMNNGILYELDMRLRPSGNAGLLMIHIDSFAQYQEQDAWTWEHQALVRARVIYGHSTLTATFNDIKRRVLMKERDKVSLREDVTKMRLKMRQHLDKSSEGLIDIKQGRGGLVDIEFLVQYLVLAHCAEHPNLSCYSDNINLLKYLANVGVINQTQQQTLETNYCQLRDFGHHATLKNMPAMIAQQTFIDQHSDVMVVVKQLLQADK
ncbi:glutamate-ammonia-ligase adenylyltransferase [Colwellia chukchiensis]|uniref:Bifunctional glutamine synthetase adenylyltransferase/adenylyl-removing enzyme n=1 Tax=Colwellia chukchiensis TaxID=641665 RepID=A0A1H7J1Q7_9GAMM|nr:bifunctional [glutamate--ammonia ligase]-adenylyl-L-tyrosine phosphorylase/[glutamate--ammonia-ligase] adenylyltransferase [Colwellia chukchiensis]SEK68142.1 glutamate-ammonia-ligase adenylyltransferase [Colwellia chukchiensis]